MDKYNWYPGMREISGFGGAYEEACREMVKIGCEWLDIHPEVNPQFSGYNGVYGVINEDNEDAEQLSEVIVNAPLVAAGGGPTGAMHQAAISHILFIKRNGWDKYVEEMSK